MINVWKLTYNRLTEYRLAFGDFLIFLNKYDILPNKGLYN